MEQVAKMMLERRLNACAQFKGNFVGSKQSLASGTSSKQHVTMVIAVARGGVVAASVVAMTCVFSYHNQARHARHGPAPSGSKRETDLRLPHQSPGDGNPLLLAATELDSALPYTGVIAIGPGPSPLGRPFNLASGLRVVGAIYSSWC